MHRSLVLYVRCSSISHNNTLIWLTQRFCIEIKMGFSQYIHCFFISIFCINIQIWYYWMYWKHEYNVISFNRGYRNYDDYYHRYSYFIIERGVIKIKKQWFVCAVRRIGSTHSRFAQLFTSTIPLLLCDQRKGKKLIWKWFLHSVKAKSNDSAEIPSWLRCTEYKQKNAWGIQSEHRK